MKKVLIFLCVLFSFCSLQNFAQKKVLAELPVKYEELTVPEFLNAIDKSAKTCIIPLGILEKHGPHLPLGTDLLNIRELTLRAAKEEYVVIFPQYYVGQINEAKHQPGTIAYSHNLIWDMLQETCNELSRNGFKKIILVNGHGGNNDFVKYFCMSQMANHKDYAIYLFNPQVVPEETETAKKMIKSTVTGGHADETETSNLMYHRPELVHLDKASTQSGLDQKRLESLPDVFTGIWWYARFPNHYAGDGSKASYELGKYLMDESVKLLVKMIKEVKADSKVLEIQDQFYKKSANPLNTKQ